MLRDSQHYRRDAFDEGLKRAGYEIHSHIANPGPGDVLVIWNRYSRWHIEARRFEAAGARVVVAENGYLGKSWLGGEWFALAIGHHGGSGQWVDGGPARWDSLGVEMGPWRERGTNTVILGQRGIGEPGIASPDGWAESARRQLGQGRIRPHPGKGSHAVDLARDLADANMVVTWASSAALLALLWGIPVRYACPGWIGAGASIPLMSEGPLKRDDEARLAMFRRLAWAQFSLDEVRTGYPFGLLLAGGSRK
jgi:hypothetical protein